MPKPGWRLGEKPKGAMHHPGGRHCRRPVSPQQKGKARAGWFPKGRPLTWAGINFGMEKVITAVPSGMKNHPLAGISPSCRSQRRLMARGSLFHHNGNRKLGSCLFHQGYPAGLQAAWQRPGGMLQVRLHITGSISFPCNQLLKYPNKRLASLRELRLSQCFRHQPYFRGARNSLCLCSQEAKTWHRKTRPRCSFIW